MISGKPCKVCGEWKVYAEFPKESKNKDGRSGRCKPCQKLLPGRAYTDKRKEYLREYAIKHAERLKAWRAEYQKKNKEAIRARKTEYREKNKRVIAERDKDYYERNKRRINRYKSEWYARNRSNVLARTKLYYESNKESVFRYYRERYRRCPDFRSRKMMYSLLRKTLEKTGGKKVARTSKHLRYTPEQLRKKLEFQMAPGMSWDNYGEWHIDHKIPVSHFLKNGETRPYVINALCNLQPLWAYDNMKKRDSHPLKEQNPCS